MAVEYQGGNDTILTNFYNRLAQDQNRFFSGLEKQQAAQAKAESERKKNLEKELASLQSSINPKGLRQEDTEKFYTKYNEFKQIAARAISEGGVNGALARAEADKKLMEINMLINNSGSTSKEFSDIGQVFTTEKAALLPEGAFENYKRIIKKPTDEITTEDRETLRNYMKPQVNGSEVISKIQKKIQDLARNSEKSTRETVRLAAQGNIPAALVDYEVRNLDRAKVVSLLDSEYNVDPYFKATMNQLFGGANKDQALLQFADELIEQGFTKYRTKLDTRIARQDSDGGGDSNSIQGIGNPTRQSFRGDETLVTTTEQGRSVNRVPEIFSTNFVTYDLGSANLPQLDGVYEVATGQTVRTPSLDGAKITGLGYFPIKGGNSEQLMMSVVKDEQEYLIPYSKIPQDFKTKKLFKAVVDKLEKNRGGKPIVSSKDRKPSVKSGQNTSKPKTGQGVIASPQLLQTLGVKTNNNGKATK